MDYPEKVAYAHHSSLADGGEMAAGGVLRAKAGRVTDINNESGHYQPPAQNLYNAVDSMDQRGMGISHAVGGFGTNVSAFGVGKVDALSALAGQTPERATLMQAHMDEAGKSGPKKSLVDGLGEARITDEQAGLATHYESIIQRRREMDELRSGGIVSSIFPKTPKAPTASGSGGGASALPDNPLYAWNMPAFSSAP